MKKIVLFLLFCVFSSVVIASNHEYKVTYLKNKTALNSESQQQSLIKQEYLQVQEKLQTTKSQNQQLAEKLEQLSSQNQVLQNLNAGQQQKIDQQQKIIRQLKEQLNFYSQQQSAFSSSHLIAEKSLLNSPWFNQLMQQLDLPLAVTGAVLIIILLLLLLFYHSFCKPSFIQQLSEDNVTETETPEPVKSVNYKYLAGEDVVAAKLNLAHAYYDMDDFRGAKEILIDIIKEGAAEQQEEARNLLVKINSDIGVRKNGVK